MENWNNSKSRGWEKHELTFLGWGHELTNGAPGKHLCFQLGLAKSRSNASTKVLPQSLAVTNLFMPWVRMWYLPRAFVLSLKIDMLETEKPDGNLFLCHAYTWAWLFWLQFWSAGPAEEPRPSNRCSPLPPPAARAASAPSAGPWVGICL